MQRLYIVRHGEPDFPGGVWLCIGSGTDLPLSARGREQAAALRPYFEARPVAALWASPLNRAVETASLMTGGKYTIHTHRGLREAYIGEWEGLSPAEIRQRFPGSWEKREADMSIPPGGGEDYGAAGARFEAALREILAADDGDVAVAAHQAVTCGFLCRITGTPLSRWPDFAHDYATVTELAFENGAFSLLSFGNRV